MNAILENVHHKNDNNYNIEMAIVTYNECINFNIIRQSRTIVLNHNDNNDDDNNNNNKKKKKTRTTTTTTIIIRI